MKISSWIAYSSTTMETGDHFKTGASPKSLTGRGNLRNLVSYV
jgi:hypothetical protein